MAQYARTPERAKVLDRHPDYAVEIGAAGGRYRAEADGVVVAESARALLVRESFHDPVIYFPRADVDAERLERTAHRTRCPFKGDASYYALRTPTARHDNAVWVYEDPMAEVAALGDHLAFYPAVTRVLRVD